MTPRPLHPDLLARLQLEADAISTALTETIRRSHERAVAAVATWEPATYPTTDEAT